MKGRYLLVLGASRHQIPTIEAAQKIGFKVVVADNIASNPGHQLADVSIIADTTDIDVILDIAHDYSIVGALSPCTDVAVATAAIINETKLQGGVDYDIAKMLTSKTDFRAYQQKFGLPHPRFFTADDSDSITLDFTNSWIVKPDKSSGSKGISIVDNQDDLDLRVKDSAKVGLNSKVIIEEFINGHQGTLEGELTDGEVSQLYFLDRVVPAPPHVCTLGHRLPTQLNKQIQAQIADDISVFWKKLGIENAVFDIDFIWDGQQLIILEASPRLGGNSISKLLKLFNNANMVETAISKIVINSSSQQTEPVWLEPRPSAVVLVGVNTSGKLLICHSEIKKINAKKWVKDIDIFASDNQQVQPFTDGRQCVAAFFIQADTYEQLVEREKKIRATLFFDVV